MVSTAVAAAVVANADTAFVMCCIASNDWLANCVWRVATGHNSGVYNILEK